MRLRGQAAARLAALFILLAAYGARVHLLEAQSLWNDEGSSYVQALRSVPQIIENAGRDIHPPGYYLLLAGWRLLTGETEFALRSLSVLASALTVALVYRIGARLFGRGAGALAAALVALNTFSIHYAQEARMYALLALWGAAGMALVAERSATERQSSAEKRRSDAVWVSSLMLVNAAGLYTHYAYPFALLAQGLAFLALLTGRPRARLPRPLILYALANGGALLLFLPWLPTALRQVMGWPNTGQPIPAVEALGAVLGWFALGITHESGSDWASVFILGFTLIGLLIGLRRGAARPIALALLWALLPAALFLLLGLFRPANLKFLLPSQAGFALCVGAALHGWTRLAAGTRYIPSLRLIIGSTVAIILLAALSGLPSLYSDPRYQRADYRAISALIMADSRPGDAIILDAPNQEEVFRYYYRGDAPIYPLPPGLGGDDAQTQAAVRQIIAEYARVFVLFWGEAERDPNRIVETTLDGEAFEAGQDVWYGDVRLARYVMPARMPAPTPLDARFGGQIALTAYALSARTLRAGDVLQVRLEWRADKPVARRYKVFVQLLDAAGALAAQRDAEPGGGSLPTTAWTPGAAVADNHGLALTAALAPGRYTLIVGLYDIDDPAARLPTETGGDYITLGEITVRE